MVSSAADEGADDVGDEADGAERDAAVEVAVAHVDQERAQQRLREVVGELVEDDEGEDLERAVARRGSRGTGSQTASRSVRRRDGDARSGSGASQVTTSIGR